MRGGRRWIRGVRKDPCQVIDSQICTLTRIDYHLGVVPSPQVQEQALLTVDEAAIKLRISSVTCRRLIAAGRLPSVKVGDQLRIGAAAVAAIVDAANGASMTMDAPRGIALSLGARK